MSNARTLLVVVVASTAVWQSEFAWASPPYPGAPNVDYRLLVEGQFLSTGGLRVSYVNPQGPGVRLMSDRGPLALEPNDTILAINGWPIRQPNDLYRELARSGGSEVHLTVADGRSGEVIGCRVFPARLDRGVGAPTWPDSRSFMPIVPPGATVPQPAPAATIRVLLIAQTADPCIGASTAVSLRRMREALLNVPSIRSQDVQVLWGADVQADRILSAVQTMPVGPTDVVFCYYTGHGAYDPRGNGSDPSGGHFLQLPTGDLARATLMQALLAKNARLTVLITDSCNVGSEFRPRLPRRTVQALEPSYSVLDALFRGYVGVVDLNGSARDQFGWGSPDIGGWFTDAFLSSAQEPIAATSMPTWPEFIARAADQTSRTFSARKVQILSVPAYDSGALQMRNALGQQVDQRPQAFGLNVYPAR
jgi:hypothetical protein